MKQLIAIAALCLAYVVPLRAQTSIEFIPAAGYTFPDKVNFYDAYGRIEGAANYGGSLQFNVNKNFGIELMYNRIDAGSGIYNYGSRGQFPLSTQDVHINYIMAGPVQSFGFPQSPVRLFIGGMLGAAVFDPGPIDYSSNTKFAWGAQLGTNVYVTPRFGIRLKAQLLSPVDNGGFYFADFGNGSGYSGYSTIYQFGFSAGFIIGLGRVLPEPKRVIIYHRAPRGRYAPYYRY